MRPGLPAAPGPAPRSRAPAAPGPAAAAGGRAPPAPAGPGPEPPEQRPEPPHGRERAPGPRRRGGAAAGAVLPWKRRSGDHGAVPAVPRQRVPRHRPRVPPLRRENLRSPPSPTLQDGGHGGSGEPSSAPAHLPITWSRHRPAPRPAPSYWALCGARPLTGRPANVSHPATPLSQGEPQMAAGSRLPVGHSVHGAGAPRFPPSRPSNKATSR